MKKHIFSVLAACIGMIILILDTKTAITGVSNGISVCLSTLIPALFPFIIITKLISSYLLGRRISALKPLGKACGIPEGFEFVIPIGLLGGYPVGASIIADAYRSSQVDRSSATRMLGFCSNAGPSFIFGMTTFLFDSFYIGWYIWFIQILSALIVGHILPNKTLTTAKLNASKGMTFVEILETSVKNMSVICGWVILFQVVIAYIDTWFNLLDHSILKTVVIGFLELSNGCIYAKSIPSQETRFVLINALLSFGGICVYMQTQSAVRRLPTNTYLLGKMLQCSISTVLSIVVQYHIFATKYTSNFTYIALGGVVFIIIALIVINPKKSVASTKKLLYNQHNKGKGNEA